MNPIAQALASGYTADQVLNFMSRAFPALKGKIKKALVGGFAAKDILKAISQGMGGQQSEGMTAEQIQGNREQSRSQVTKGLAATAAAGGLGLATRASSIPASILPESPSNIGPAPMSDAPVSPPPISPAGQANVAAAAPAVQPVKPEVSPEKMQAEQVLKQFGVEDRVKQLAASGKLPEDIASTIEMEMHPATRRSHMAKRGTGQEKPLAAHIKEYLTTPEGLLREDVLNLGQETNVKPALHEEVKPEKGAMVATPSGIGQIKDIREKEALIESDGKLHKAKIEDLIQSPLPEKDLADLYEDVVRGVEKETGEEVSRNVNFAGYDPKTKTLAYLPHLGALYTYEDIDEEDAKLLTSILNTRKTSGENFLGAWSEGSKSPIGAAMSALIKKLQAQAGGKGKEYSHKFETLYSALEPAIKALKNKKKKKK